MRGMDADLGRLCKDTEKFISEGNPKSNNLIDEIYLRANDLNDEIAMVWYSYLKGLFAVHKGEYALAHDELETTLIKAKELSVFTVEIKTAKVLGDLHHKIDDFYGALNYYLLCLELDSEVFYEIEEKASVLTHIGDIYKALEQFSVAIEYYQEALDLNNSKVDKGLFINLQSKLAWVYLEERQLDLALKTINQYFQKAVELGSDHEMALGYEQYAHYYWAIGDFRETESFFEKAKKKMLYLGLNNEVCSLLADYGQFLFEQNRLDMAFDVFYEGSLILLDQNDCDSELTIYLYLAKIYELKDNHQKAYEYFKRYHELKSMKDETWKTIKIKNIVNKYEFLRSDLKVKELENTNQNMRIISAIGREITSKIELRQVISKVAEKIHDLFNSYTFMVGVLQDKYKMDVIIHNGTEGTDYKVTNRNKRWYTFSLLNDVVKNNDFNRREILDKQYSINTKIFHNVKSFISSPLVYDNQCIGLIMIQNSHVEAFQENHLEVLKILSSYISIAIHNSAQSIELFETNIKLKELTERDGLTKVYNRYALNKNLKRIIRKAYTYDRPFGIIMIDVDFFKEYNDNYGHLSGDQVLIKVSKTLSKIIQPFENQSIYNFFRYGGDEFVIVIMDRDEHELIEIGEGLKNAVSDMLIPHKFSKCASIVTITAGIGIVKKSTEDYESLFALADQALYKAKKQGRNNVKILVYE